MSSRQRRQRGLAEIRQLLGAALAAHSMTDADSFQVLAPHRPGQPRR